MKIFTSTTQTSGRLGEDLACRYLTQKGHIILERNHTRKWGEIDVVTKFENITHFVEVKSVTREINYGSLDEVELIRPEDHMDRLKQQRLHRTISIYIQQKRTKLWQFDLLCIFIDRNRKKAIVRRYDDLILSES